MSTFPSAETYPSLSTFPSSDSRHDDFETDTVSVFEQFGSTNLTHDAADEALKKTSSGSVRAIRKNLASPSQPLGWTPLEDQKVRVRYKIGTTMAGQITAIAKWQDDSNYLRCEITPGENKLQVEAVVGGVSNVIGIPAMSTTALPAHNENASHWVEIEVKDYKIAGRWSRSDPASNPWDYDTGFRYHQVINDFDVYDAGRVGFRWNPGDFATDRIEAISLTDEANPDLRHPVAAEPADYSLPTPYSGDLHPPASWRLLHDDSIWNELLPANPPVHPDSAAMVATLIANGQSPEGGPGHIRTNAPDNSWSIPIYFAEASDPLYTIINDGAYYDPASWPLHNTQIRIPEEAQPASPEEGDAHICIVQPDGTVHDFFHVTKVDSPTYELTVRNGGTMPSMYGRGAGPWEPLALDWPPAVTAATAARTLGPVGLIRVDELKAGVIEHALQFSAPQHDDRLYTWPSRHPGGSSPPPDGLGPQVSMGARMTIAYTEAEIDALADVDDWQKIVLHAIRRYGLIMSDSGATTWKVRGFLAPQTYTSFSWEDPILRYAAQQFAAGADHIVFDEETGYISWRISNGIDWTRLRVLEYAEGQKWPR